MYELASNKNIQYILCETSFSTHTIAKTKNEKRKTKLKCCLESLDFF